MFGGIAAVLIAQSSDLGCLAAAALRRATSTWFLRLATLALAQALDLATFSVMVGRHGAGAEANPLVGDLFGSFGMPAVALAKVALVVLIGALSVVALSERRPGVAALIGGLPLALAITAGLIGGITNAATILG